MIRAIESSLLFGAHGSIMESTMTGKEARHTPARLHIIDALLDAVCCR